MIPQYNMCLCIIMSKIHFKITWSIFHLYLKTPSKAAEGNRKWRPSSSSFPMNTEAPAVPLLSGLGQITEHLFLSSGRAANNIVLVSNSRITCIINVTQDVVNTHIPAVEYVRVPVADSPRSRLSEYFDLIADRIDEEGAKSGRALVHCNAGVSRSATLCLAYLMKYRNMTLLEAHRLVKARRPIVRPNNGFWKQLIDYENRLHGKVTVRMVTSPIGEIPDIYEEGTKGMIPC